MTNPADEKVRQPIHASWTTQPSDAETREQRAAQYILSLNEEMDAARSQIETLEADARAHRDLQRRVADLDKLMAEGHEALSQAKGELAFAQEELLRRDMIIGRMQTAMRIVNDVVIPMWSGVLNEEQKGGLAELRQHLSELILESRAEDADDVDLAEG